MGNDLFEIETDPRDPTHITMRRVSADEYYKGVQIPDHVLDALLTPAQVAEMRRNADELYQHIGNGVDTWRLLDIANGKIRPTLQWLAKPRTRKR